MQQRKALIKGKSNECTKSIEILSYLEEESKKANNSENEKEGDQIAIKFMLGEGLWTKANISKTNKKVKLWLGANSMVEFTYLEAIGAMKAKENEFKEALILLEKDIEWLRCQITTVEVSMGRLYQLLSIQNAKKQQQQQQAQSKAMANIQSQDVSSAINKESEVTITPEQAQKLAAQLSNAKKF